jgi:F-type H+-transporting ATPase subunit b
LNWSTFVLEIINFLILVWILKRFLYKPVLDVIRRRQVNIQKNLDDAQALQQQATIMEEKYKNRLTEWENERNVLYTELEEEIEAERQKRLAALHVSLEEEQKKSKQIEQRKLEILRLNLEKNALAQGAQFSARLLSEAAGPELENNLLMFFLKELSSLSSKQLDMLHSSASNNTNKILVSSAYPIENDMRQILEDAIKNKLKLNVPIHYELNKELLAGIRIAMGAWVLQLNLRDELKSFAELAHEA